MNVKPLHGHVAVLDLPEETLRLAGVDLLEVTALPSPGYFVGRVVALPDSIPDGLQVGDKVIVQGQSSPFGAGYWPSEDFGLPPGGRVILVPCRILASPEGSSELVERRRHMANFRKGKPAEKYPPEHRYWTTPQGEAELVQMGEHAWRVRNILARRRSCGRDRLMKPVDDVAQTEGILAVIEG